MAIKVIAQRRELKIGTYLLTNFMVTQLTPVR